ncbi:MAG: hypothetical protein HY591_00190, partial [Candidatus Omnitrophica bacterium]|nr:hypothetical protein [Candidatus Omnitrophota bacterium]
RPETKDPKINALGSQIVRQIILPEIEKEVNEGKTFANLRQIYNSMILAAWYKNTLKESLLGKVYADKNKIKGIDVEDKNAKQKIYEQYLAAFKKGVYNYIKEDYDPHAQTMVPRKYFSGGVQLRLHFQTGRANSRGPDAAMTVLKDQSQIPQPLWAELFKHNVAVVTTRLAENATFRGAVPDRAMNAALAEAIENILSEKIRGFKKQQKIKIIEGIRKLVAQTEKPIFYLTSVDLEEKPTQGKVIPEVVLWRSHPTVSVGVMKKLVQTRLSGILSQLRPGLLEAVFEFGKNGRNVTGLGLIFKDRKAQFSPEERERLQQEILGVLDKVLELLPPDKAQLATAPNADRAMRTDEIDDVGGISLKPAHMNLQVKRDGKGVPLPVSMQPANMDIEGFLPVIIRVQDADMPQLLGLTDTRIKGTRT